MQKYYIFLNLGPAAGPVQAYTIVLQLPIIETRAEVLLGLAKADEPTYISTLGRRNELNPSSWRTVSIPGQVHYEVVRHVFFAYCLIIYSDPLCNISNCQPPVT